MLVSIAMLCAAVFLAALLPLHRAIAVVGTCVLLAVYPIPSLVAIASMAAAYLSINLLRRKTRHGIRRLPRSRS
jgi:hypothetical protein